MRKTSLLRQKPFFTKKRIIMFAIVIVFSGLVWFYSYNFTSFSSKNYARDVAAPIEKELVAAGAVKVCERGNNGKGISNREPWYGADFETNLNSANAESLILDVAKKTGYDLKKDTQAHSTSYIDDSMQSSFSELETGNVKVTFSIYADSQKLNCNVKYINHDANNVVIGVGISLPVYRNK